MGLLLFFIIGSLAGLFTFGSDAEPDNDPIDNEPQRLIGTEADESFSSGIGDDNIWSAAGNDTIESGGGNDTIFAGLDNDLANGGEGDDSVSGELGNDTLYGADGHDALLGDPQIGNINEAQDDGYGDDLLFGGEGNDTLLGEAGNDTLFGGKDDDFLYGDDILGFGNGSDYIVGEAGDDFIDGASGSDTIFGGSGHDNIINKSRPGDLGGMTDGGDGDDTILATGAKVDTDPSLKSPLNDYPQIVHGGNGDDSILAIGGAIEVYGDDGNDNIVLRSPLAGAFTPIDGGDGDDTIVAPRADGKILGGAGNDDIQITSRVARDGANWEIRAGEGDDTVTFFHDATIFGDDGNDSFQLNYHEFPRSDKGETATIADFDPAQDVLVVEYTPDFLRGQASIQTSDLSVEYRDATDETIVTVFGDDAIRLSGMHTLSPTDIRIVETAA